MWCRKGGSGPQRWEPDMVNRPSGGAEVYRAAAATSVLVEIPRLRDGTFRARMAGGAGGKRGRRIFE